jgi:hypothetical protein
MQGNWHSKNSTDKLESKELFGRPKNCSLMPKVPYPYEVNGKLEIGHRKWFLNTNLFLIKPFLIAKFDCTCKKILVLQTKSLYKSCTVSNSYRTEIEICAGFGPVRAGFSCFHVRLTYNDFDCNTIDIPLFRKRKIAYTV